MGMFVSEPHWLKIVSEQEKMLCFTSFTQEDALKIGLLVIELAKNKYHGSAAVRIIADDTVWFAYKMPGTSLENDWWMTRKINTSKLTGVSSLRAYLEIEEGFRKESWRAREGSFVACGGCIPVLMREGEPFAYIAVSGLRHEEDHQLAADAIAAHLKMDIRSILG